jgi:hypothetical protein
VDGFKGTKCNQGFLRQITFSRSFGSKPQVVLKTNIKSMAQVKNKNLR